MTPRCDQYRLHIEAYVDGELSGDEVAVLEQHFAGCESCAVYRDELVRLRSAFDRLALRQDAPDVSPAVVRGARRQLRARFALAAAGVVVLKLLDVFGVFGGGIVPGLVVAVGAVIAFSVIRINPFRLVRPEEILRADEAAQGVAHASS